MVITTLQSGMRLSFSYPLCWVCQYLYMSIYIQVARDLQFKVDYKRKIFEKLSFMAISLILIVFAINLLTCGLNRGVLFNFIHIRRDMQLKVDFEKLFMKISFILRVFPRMTAERQLQRTSLFSYFVMCDISDLWFEPRPLI